MAIEYDQLGNVIQGSGLDVGVSKKSAYDKYANRSANRIKAQAQVQGISNLSVTQNPFGKRDVPGVPPGAQPEPIAPVEPVVIPQQPDKTKIDPSYIDTIDTRVRIRVPSKYLTAVTSGFSDELSVTNLGGIIFPYTPSITYSVKAEYATQTPLHSNFALQFFKNSSIGEISISGKFSVENAKDAELYISTVHLIKSLIRMRSGGAREGDADSGSPPPVCRLEAYGDMMLKNVPIVINSFRIDLPDNVDYFSFKGNNPLIGYNSVPTLSTIQITCLPMYSRNEMRNFSVNNYVNNVYRGQGYI